MRRSNSTSVVVPTDRDSNVSDVDNGRNRPEREWGNEQPKAARPFGPQDVLVTGAQETQRRADLTFSIGVALALALPVFLGIGV
jgi:hypothetical protein